MSRFRSPYFMLVIFLITTGLSLELHAATGVYLPGSVSYPRVVRLAHGPASSNGRIIASTKGLIFESSDEGHTFKSLGEIPARAGSTLRCCETLFELPATVGRLAAGTLLYAATYVSGASPAIEVFTSEDAGRHWTYHSTPVIRSKENKAGGLWEPEFSVARDGALVMFWSDETYACCSQKLVQIRTADGVTWEDQADTVASPVRSDRPGMIVVSKLPTGGYFMSYEVCGDPTPQPLLAHEPVGGSMTGPKCDVYFRISKDGWDYGPPADLGRRIETATGQYFQHAPTNRWSPSPMSANGVIVVVGQVLHEVNGSISPLNGKVLLVNPLLDGSGPWTVVAAPVQVPNAYNNPCPNYSSALLPVSGGAALLELAADYRAVGECGTFYATKSWDEMTAPVPK